MKKIELLSPAGSFESGYYAIKNGADAVYLGVQNFSARKSARNFNFDEIRSLKTVASEKNARIFAALNTVIEEKNTDLLIETIYNTSNCGIDGFIIQDPAIIEITKKLNLDIELHASTQMAVHNIEGAAFLADQGIKRAVLSRELPLKDIEKIKKTLPDLELEVFIHGALCYSFSGLCLASGLLLDRSGNQGECAQLCRSFYKWNKKAGYPFSCNDLNMSQHIHELISIGVDSLKIEGRMKSPEYVANVTAYYRKLIDSNFDDRAIKDTIKTIFSRKENDSYAKERSGKELISADYPGHRGLFIGKSGKKTKTTFELIPSENISIKDGIMFFKEQINEPFRVSIEMLTEKSGKERRFAEKGKPIFIKSEYLPEENSPIYLISSRNNDLKQVSSASFRLWKKPIRLDIFINNSEIITKADGFPPFSEQVKTETSENSIENVIKSIYMKSDKSLFIPSEINITSENTNIFINPSDLKTAKRNFYEFLESETRNKIKKAISELNTKTDSTEKKELNSKILLFMSKRENLNPVNKINNSESREIPFITHQNLKDINTISNYMGTFFLPLIPVIYSDENYLDKIKKLLEQNPDKNFILGLNNIGHLNFANKVSSLNNVSFFIDFYLYIANRFSANYYTKQSPKIVAAYKWLEKKSDFYSEIPLIETGKTFNPPLFLSVGCFRKHNEDGCANCLKSYAYNIDGDKFRFRIIGKECKTYLFKETQK